MEFPRTRKTSLELPLTAMIDVVFILIIFFMLTTTFMKMESMEVMLPTVSPVKKKAPVADDITRIYLQGDGDITYGEQPMDRIRLNHTLSSVFGTYPEQRMMVMVSGTVSLQSLVDVMDMIYAAGGKNVLVKEWTPPPAPTPAVPEVPLPPLLPMAPTPVIPFSTGAR